MRKIFIDCGAWYGNSISKFRSMYPEWEEYDIYAFEANKEVYDIGKKAIPDVTWINAGVWDSDGERTLRTGKGKWSESSTFFKHKRYGEKEGQKNYQRVKMIDLSKWIQDNFIFDDYIILKMNVEGAEYKVLPKMLRDKTIGMINELYVDWHWHKMNYPKDDHYNLVESLPVECKRWKNDHKKKCVYTVLTGNDPAYTLKEPKRINTDWDYICFTNRDNIKSDMWQIKQINDSNSNDILISRKVKILCDYYLPDYDLSIYIDSKFTPRIDLNSFVNNNHRSIFTVMSHPKRHCVYDELKVLDSNGAAMWYRDHGIPKGTNVFAPGIMIRNHHDDIIIGVMNEWYKEVCRYTTLGNKPRDIPPLSVALVNKREMHKVNEIDFKLTTGLFK